MQTVMTAREMALCSHNLDRTAMHAKTASGDLYDWIGNEWVLRKRRPRPVAASSVTIYRCGCFCEIRENAAYFAAMLGLRVLQGDDGKNVCGWPEHHTDAYTEKLTSVGIERTFMTWGRSNDPDFQAMARQRSARSTQRNARSERP